MGGGICGQILSRSHLLYKILQYKLSNTSQKETKFSVFSELVAQLCEYSDLISVIFLLHIILYHLYRFRCGKLKTISRKSQDRIRPHFQIFCRLCVKWKEAPMNSTVVSSVYDNRSLRLIAFSGMK